MGKRSALTFWLLLALMLAGVVWMGYDGQRRAQLRLPLLEAAGRQDAAEVQRLLDAGADPNSRDMVPVHRSAWQAFLDSLPYLRRRRPLPETGPTALMIACAGERVAPMPNDPMQLIEYNNRWKTPGLWSRSSAGRDDPAAARLLLDHGARVNAQGEGGWSALMSAASTGHPQIARLLLKRGADANAGWEEVLPLTEEMFVLPLTEVIYSDSFKRSGDYCATAQALLDAGAKVEGVYHRETMLQAAALHGDMAMVRLLLDRGADVDDLPVPDCLESPALSEAARAGNGAMVKLLLSRGAKINASPQAGFTPLAAAAEGRQEAMLRFLISQGADINAPSADGNTALIWASMKDEPKSVALLMAHGARVSAVNRAGHTALYFAHGPSVVRMVLWPGASRTTKTLCLEQAALQGDVSSVRLLLTEGAVPNGHDWQGKTVLINALDGAKGVHENAILAMLRTLVAHGADVNLADSEGVTPLMHGIQDVPISRFLLEHHADVNARTVNPRTTDGYTALMEAVQNCDIGTVRLLLSHGADVNVCDKSGTTVLLYAVETYAVNRSDPDALAVIRLLLKHGADLDAQDNQGQSARTLAAAIPSLKAVPQLTAMLASHKPRAKVGYNRR